MGFKGYCIESTTKILEDTTKFVFKVTDKIYAILEIMRFVINFFNNKMETKFNVFFIKFKQLPKVVVDALSKYTPIEEQRNKTLLCGNKT